jgi:hypothetical protein
MGNYYCLGCDRGMQSHCFLLAQVPICRKLLLTWEIIVYMGNYCCLGCPVSLRHPGSGISLHLLYRKLLFTWEIIVAWGALSHCVILALASLSIFSIGNYCLRGKFLLPL